MIATFNHNGNLGGFVFIMFSVRLIETKRWHIKYKLKDIQTNRCKKKNADSWKEMGYSKYQVHVLIMKCLWPDAKRLTVSYRFIHRYNDNLDCVRLVVKDPFTALDKTGALVSIWPNVFNHVKFSRESGETFDVKNKSACFKAFISRSTTNLTHPSLAALLIRIRFLKQVKYLIQLSQQRMISCDLAI